LITVVLAAAVTILALRHAGVTRIETTTTVATTRTFPDPALKRGLAALGARVADVERSRTALLKTVAALDSRVDALAARLGKIPSSPAGEAALRAQVRALGTKLQTANQCLFQVQKQLDDIQGYFGTKAALKKRVTGPCLLLLRPRFAGQ